MRDYPGATVKPDIPGNHMMKENPGNQMKKKNPGDLKSGNQMACNVPFSTKGSHTALVRSKTKQRKQHGLFAATLKPVKSMLLDGCTSSFG
eukprot:c1043_g1_i1 orf=2-271(-)